MHHTLFTTARQMHSQHAPPGFPLPPLIFMSDESRVPTAKIIPCLPQDCLVILREYAHPERAAQLASLAKLCQNAGLAYSIAGDLELALALQASALHASERCLSNISEWRARYPHLPITAAAHTYDTITTAAEAGATACLCSPVFPTASHPKTPALGSEILRNWASTAPLPLYALGGISEENIAEIHSRGAVGIAGCTLFHT